MKHFNFLKPLALTFALLLGGVGATQAQNIWAIFGTVTDGAGNPVANETVTIVADSSVTPFFYWSQVTTNASGHYGDTIVGGPAPWTFYVSVMDTCSPGGAQSQVVTTQTAQGFATVDFTICPNVIGSCQANFWQFPDSINSNIWYFADNSTNAVSYVWSFGDGNTSTMANPTHVYAQAGTYNVCLTIDDGAGCTDQTCSVITVTGGPGGSNCDASFTAIAGSMGINFAPSTFVQTWMYNWSFGDGTTSTQSYPTHNYNAPGVYVACLTVDDSLGCTATSCDTIVVTGTACQANFWAFDSLGTWQFGSSSTGNNLTYVWDFGDSTIGTGQYPWHTYSSPGTYTVCLTIDDGAGCTDTYCQTITVNGTGGGCDAQWYNTVGNNYDVYFYDWSSGANLTYSWDFGDGTTSTLANPSHTYSAAGWYYVCLTIDDGAGCTDSYCDYVDVNDCDATFTLSENNGLISGTNTSNGGSSFDWLIIDPNGNWSWVYSSTNLSYQTNANGIYNICLYSYDSLQQFCDSACATIAVNGGGGPIFNMDICGSVYAGGNYADAGLVYLIQLDTVAATLTAIDTSSIDSGGYCFNNLPVGTYYVKAALDPASMYYSGYLPTYYGDQLYWVAASTISSTNFGADINLVAGNNPGGPGFIGGSVWQGSNKTAGEGDPVEGMQILLLDANDNPVAFTTSDANGEYEFSNLAYGTYKVYGEMWGLTTIPNVVEVTSGEPAVAEVNLVVGESMITTGINDDDVFNNDAISGFWPNPATDQANVAITVTNTDRFTFTVYNAVGQQVMTTTQTVAPGNDRVLLNVNDLSEGLYHVRIQGADTGIEQTRKLIVTR